MKFAVFAFGVLLTTVPTILANLDFFSSTLNTRPLLETHNQLLGILRQYASALSQTSFFINSFLSEPEVAKLTGPWPNDGDPLKTYLLIRRTFKDIDNIVAAIRNQRSLDPLLEIENLRNKGLLPGEYDLNGISSSLVRLQRTYLLNPKNLVQGKVLNSLQLDATLSAADCLKLGENAEELGPIGTIPVDAKLWYKAGLEAYENETDRDTAEKKGIKAKLEERLQGVKNKSLSSVTFPDEFNDFINKDILTQPLDPVNTSWPYLTTIYRRLCRGETLRVPSMERKNVCYLRRGPHAYLKLRPLKVEMKSLDPYLVVLHDIVGDNAIEALKGAALSKATRSSHIVANSSSGITDIRVSTTSWLPDDVAPSLVQRLGILLGLKSNATVYDVEMFQVLNYGIGGHYMLHRDYFEDVKADTFRNKSGERVATLMLYLSNVEEGGATVFPYAGLALKPIKGAAAFWWNVRNDGEGDYRTTHGACPVIYGTKWVSNKWFRIDPQMFLLPCGLRAGDIMKEL